MILNFIKINKTFTPQDNYINRKQPPAICIIFNNTVHI